MQFNKFLAQIQPKPCPHDALRIVRPGKPLEHLRLLVRRNAHAMIAYLHDDLVLLLISLDIDLLTYCMNL